MILLLSVQRHHEKTTANRSFLCFSKIGFSLDKFCRKKKQISCFVLENKFIMTKINIIFIIMIIIMIIIFTISIIIMIIIFTISIIIMIINNMIVIIVYYLVFRLTGTVQL